MRAAAQSWLVVAVAGQWIFAFYVASTYGAPAARGNLSAWNKIVPHGYVPGNTVGNSALAVHLVFAAIISFGGALQLMPKLRSRFPVLHRWVGRTYVLLAFTMAITGLYLSFSGRTVVGDITQHLAIEINAVAIMVCAVMAWRRALARDFQAHRRWALRLFLVVNGVWFFRVGLMFWLLINQGPVGFDPRTFEGPFLTVLAFAQYLLPLLVLELYLRAKSRPGAPGRISMAAGLGVLTVAMGAGIFAATMGMWLPRVEAALDGRKSIADVLTATIASSGVDEAARQYRALKASAPGAYNFDERELNTLGYQLIREQKLIAAIRILQLNVEAFPGSSNVYDSFAEACLALRKLESRGQ